MCNLERNIYFSNFEFESQCCMGKLATFTTRLTQKSHGQLHFTSPRNQLHQEKQVTYIFQNSKYGIYSSELPGRSFNFEFSNGALNRGRRSFEANISKGHQNIFNLSLKLNNKNNNNNRRIKCLMFKIVYKTPLFTKEKQHYIALHYALCFCKNGLVSLQDALVQMFDSILHNQDLETVTQWRSLKYNDELKLTPSSHPLST